MMAEQLLGQSSVEALHDPLITVIIHTPAPYRDTVLCHELADRTHKLLPRVNLKELRPLQGAPFVDARKSLSNLCGPFRASRRGARPL